MEHSLVSICGAGQSDCGYCKLGESASFGKTTTADPAKESLRGRLLAWFSCSANRKDYQCLIDRGWRRYSFLPGSSERSGRYLYKPDLEASCCAQFTIRLDVNAFKASKSQKKVIKRISKHTHDSANASKHSKDDDAMECDQDAFVKMVTDAESGSSHTFDVKLVRAAFEKDTFNLYKKYQIAIHKDNEDRITESQYSHFLFKPIPDNPNAPGYGSFHQKYYVDGKLIAVGFIDILPHCVSSVYFIYDPDVSFLSLGVYSALREIMFVKSLHKSIPDLHYYYMGFYIHTCDKMKYKAQYKPSDILCPKTYTWVPFEKCQQIFEKTPTSELGKLILDTDAQPELFTDEYLAARASELNLVVGKYLVKFKDLAVSDQDLFGELCRYVQQVGPMLASRMFVKL